MPLFLFFFLLSLFFLYSSIFSLFFFAPILLGRLFEADTFFQPRYAYKYRCPQLYCFDGETLLLLQFQAQKPENIKDANCPVDCWVIPRTGSAVRIRDALYRLMAQGLRRFQGMCAALSAKAAPVGGLRPQSRMFYNGWPVWKVDGGSSLTHPGGYERSTDVASGAVMWTHPDPENDELVWETNDLWGDNAPPSE